ncbi:CpsD/CapB family tyrosine-protein kinase [Tunturiibacter lichenicola]|uniref:CpsD/CapB family tyrosine-protein kinase n=1 Tax=Tunturiibacter lichenicola TaxID=2051959 RepID=UPI0021B2DE30|nr:CpsD/CapB family tyrosine-protein kinase [Edaphobacter lichenicola]
MSHIFDALERSEAERSGTDLSGLTGATELLQRAEKLAALKWENSVLLEHLNVEKSETLQTAFPQAAPPQVATIHQIPAATRPWSTDDGLDPFLQFTPLHVSLSPQSRLVSLTDSGCPAAEAFRLLGVRLRHLRRDRLLKKVLITSTIPQEGKSMVAGNLACTLALRAQQRTLLLEGDLRRPSLSQRFGIGRNPGICEYLQGERSLAASIYHLDNPNLWILPAGNAPSNALELLQSGRLSTLMDQLSVWFDWIVIDSPPVLPLADTSVWMRLSDGILLVTRQGTTERRKLQRGLEALEAKKLIGALVNGSENASDSDYYYSSTTISQSDEVSAHL